MDTLPTLLLAAWKRVEPRLHPHDLAHRLARRRRDVLTRPPRPWCLAVRASDTRLLPIDPPLARAHQAHEVYLTADDLRALCAPVHVIPPGETCDDLASRLGVTPMGLRAARLAGIFRTHHVKGLAGRRGRPTPLLYTPQPLDPAARNFSLPDPAWACTAAGLADRLPEAFHVTLTRVPRQRTHVPRSRFSEHAHPETVGDIEKTNPTRRLPSPGPDPVWYKWSRPTPDGVSHYLGDDPSNWRTSPQDPGQREARHLEKRRTKRKPAPSRSTGSLHFNGWNWLCPACGRACRTLYLPLPPIPLLTTGLPRIAELVDIPRPIDGFACEPCHRIRQFSRVAHDAWNTLVTYASAGLLYGHEVPRPEAFTKSTRAQSRKLPHTPRPNAKPSARREQVTDLLLQGLTYAAIAEKIGVTYYTAMCYARRVYQYHNVHGRKELAKKLGKPDPRPTKRSKIRELLEQGMTISKIAERLNITRKAVRDHAYVIRRDSMSNARTVMRSGHSGS